jgi:hypothetical protein
MNAAELEAYLRGLSPEDRKAFDTAAKAAAAAIGPLRPEQIEKVRVLLTPPAADSAEGAA